MHSECLGSIIVRNFLHNFKILLFQFRWLEKEATHARQNQLKAKEMGGEWVEKQK